eukprot:scaffold7403_cov122-Cylindrotheca_fusiformis.AAC.2
MKTLGHVIPSCNVFSKIRISACDLIPAAVRKCGYLPYHSHFRSDHRFAFIDFDNDILFGSGDASQLGLGLGFPYGGQIPSAQTTSISGRPEFLSSPSRPFQAGDS